MSKEVKHHILVGTATFSLGAATMAIEMTASRIVSPFFGASLFVWTSLIVTVLMAMSLGYWLGGKAAEKGAGLPQAGIVSAAAAFTLYIGTHLVPRFAPNIATLIFRMTSASIALFLGSFVFTLLAFALPVMFLASAGPMLLKSWAKGGDIGSTAGSYFATSTAGSVLGTIAPSIILVPLIGASATMDAVTLLLIIIAILLIGRTTGKYIALAVIPFSLLGPLTDRQLPANVIDEKESPYQLIRVIGDPNGPRYLTFNEATAIQSLYDPNGGPALPYIDVMGIAAVVREPKTPSETNAFNGLILGLAGGGLPRAYIQTLPPTTKLNLTGVEIDPEVIKIARKWFALDELNVKVISEDARIFLSNTPDNFDSIAIDAYSVQLYIPPHLATKEFFQLVASRLTNDGVMSMNINAPSIDSSLLKTLLNTVASVFPHVLVVPVPGTWNYAVFASTSVMKPNEISTRLTTNDTARVAIESSFKAIHDPSQATFTDDRAPIEFMTDTMMLQTAH